MRRSTAVLLIILLFLALLAWYMQTPGNPIKSALATSTSVAAVSYGSLIDPIKGPFSRISIQDATGKTVTIDKTSGIWLISAGQDHPANQELAESAAGQIYYLQIITRLEKAPDPAGTGLNKPDYTISVLLADGSNYSFKVGNPTVTGSGYYVEAADGKIYILNKSDLDTILNIFTNPPFLETAVPELTLTPTLLLPGTPVGATSHTATPTKTP